MATYRPNLKYFKESLNSIAAQTYQNYRLILVNDGSDEEELQAILSQYSFSWTVITNSENIGLTKSLNKGLLYCNAEYIARFDDDDVMEPNRLETQVSYMETNQECAAVFSNIIRIDESGNYLQKYETDDNDKIISFLCMRGNCLCHSSLLIRKDILEQLSGYDPLMLYAQDYDLYLRLIEKHKIYKLPQPLVKFRVGSNRTSTKKSVMSLLCGYYASLKRISKNHNVFEFMSRTARTIVGMYKIVFLNKIS